MRASGFDLASRCLQRAGGELPCCPHPQTPSSSSAVGRVFPTVHSNSTTSSLPLAWPYKACLTACVFLSHIGRKQQRRAASLATWENPQRWARRALCLHLFIQPAISWEEGEEGGAHSWEISRRIPLLCFPKAAAQTARTARKLSGGSSLEQRFGSETPCRHLAREIPPSLKAPTLPTKENTPKHPEEPPSEESPLLGNIPTIKSSTLETLSLTQQNKAKFRPLFLKNFHFLSGLFQSKLIYCLLVHKN